MCVQETFLIVNDAPFCHNRPSARYDSGKSFAHQIGMSFQHAGVNGEIVHSLLALFDKCVAVNLPRQIFDFSIYFFKGLVDGDSSHGDRTVPDNPLTGFVYMVAGR